eukprot:9296202-Lingulodinium_polyedra.AAC.1
MFDLRRPLCFAVRKGPHFGRRHTASRRLRHAVPRPLPVWSFGLSAVTLDELAEALGEHLDHGQARPVEL